jgi:hypothetical protein
VRDGRRGRWNAGCDAPRRCGDRTPPQRAPLLPSTNPATARATAGETLDFHWRVGVNADLAPIPGDAGFVFFPDLKHVFLPLMWADRYGTADSGQITEFTGRVYFAQNLMYGLRYGGIATAVTGGVALLVFLGFAWWRRRQREVVRARLGGQRDVGWRWGGGQKVIVLRPARFTRYTHPPSLPHPPSPPALLRPRTPNSRTTSACWPATTQRRPQRRRR